MTRKKKNIPYTKVCQYFNIPMNEACQKLGVSLTHLKKICREYDIPRWPYRKITSLQRKIDDLNAVQEQGSYYQQFKKFNKIQKLSTEKFLLENHPQIALGKRKRDGEEGSSGDDGDNSDYEGDLSGGSPEPEIQGLTDLSQSPVKKAPRVPSLQINSGTGHFNLPSGQFASSSSPTSSYSSPLVPSGSSELFFNQPHALPHSHKFMQLREQQPHLSPLSAVSNYGELKDDYMVHFHNHTANQYLPQPHDQQVYSRTVPVSPLASPQSAGPIRPTPLPAVPRAMPPSISTSPTSTTTPTLSSPFSISSSHSSSGFAVVPCSTNSVPSTPTSATSTRRNSITRLTSRRNSKCLDSPSFNFDANNNPSMNLLSPTPATSTRRNSITSNSDGAPRRYERRQRKFSISFLVEPTQ
eukprot:GEZU01042708.1.p1 GENE.GEZU01042708.1~~GEZU01042708.1.p1  ORF type:complete len:411 (-),score=79.83 GEZU01042708.1:419-1651(-)